jgi:P27 family predicted phage terminase small subunit
MKGRKPKPTVLRLVAGMPGKRPLPITEPAPEPGALVRPDWLDDYAGEMWDWLSPQLEKSRIARPVDSAAVVQYCVTYSHWRKACEWVAKHGPVMPVYRVVRTKGQGEETKVVDTKEWPQARQARQLGVLMCKLASELGITPASRTRVSTAEDGVVRTTRDEDALRKRFFSAGA